MKLIFESFARAKIVARLINPLELVFRMELILSSIMTLRVRQRKESDDDAKLF